MLKIAIAGASGRMGRVLIDAVTAAPDLHLAATPGRDPGQSLAGCDVLIDFTRPEGTLRQLAACVEHGVKLVIGTTGFDAAGRAAIVAAAERIAIVLSPNMSVGVNVVFKLIAEASRALTTGYDVEIIEAHHRNKVDAPSGTAVRMGEIVAAGRGLVLDDVATHGRAGHVGVRAADAIGFSAIRGGDIVGDHTVLFAGIGERIEITHKASSREGYATGSLLAARFVAERPHGLFDMQDVLGLR
jgi:4-hydroxy-tetrahydrodipicolinate reductase